LTGVFQMTTCLLVIQEGIIPPTINHVNPQPDCDLDYVPHRYRKMKVDTALMKARGFGGSHTSLIVKKFIAF
jgi:3-oxoacyl-[acyl-carrier-protein] synthase II